MISNGPRDFVRDRRLYDLYDYDIYVFSGMSRFPSVVVFLTLPYVAYPLPPGPLWKNYLASIGRLTEDDDMATKMGNCPHCNRIY